jgi:hypothetical protein
MKIDELIEELKQNYGGGAVTAFARHKHIVLELAKQSVDDVTQLRAITPQRIAAIACDAEALRTARNAHIPDHDKILATAPQFLEVLADELVAEAATDAMLASGQAAHPSSPGGAYAASVALALAAKLKQKKSARPAETKVAI